MAPPFARRRMAVSREIIRGPQRSMLREIVVIARPITATQSEALAAALGSSCFL